MKKIIAMSLFNLLLCTSISFAQNSSDEKATEMTDKMKNELSLTETQYESVLEINKEYISKIKEIAGEDKGRPDPETIEEITKIRKDWDAEIEKVLTEEQFKTYQANKESQKGGRNGSTQKRR